MADLSPFSDLPDDARLWIHASETPLSNTKQTALLDHLSSFIDRWTSHQNQVQGAATLLHDRFLVVAATQIDGGDISGCGKDDLAHAIDDAASELGIEWVPSLHVLYRSQEGTVTSTSRPTFQTRAEEGLVTPETPVFDPSITTLGALRNGSFEQPARESWHAQLLETPTTAP